MTTCIKYVVVFPGGCGMMIVSRSYRDFLY